MNLNFLLKYFIKTLFSGFKYDGRSPYNSAIKGKLDEIDELDFIEPILQENPTRFTLFPIMKPKLFQKYKNHVSVFWTPEEIDLSKDMKDWVKLSQNEQTFIKNVLAFFAGSDGIIQENLASRFMSEIQLAEARQFYSIQLMMEACHNETYSLLIDTYIEDKDEKLALFRVRRK